MTITTLLSHPLTLLLTQRLTTTLLVAFTTPTSPLRSVLFPLFIAWNIALLPSYTPNFQRTIDIAFIGGENIAGTISYFEKILFRQWSFSTYLFHSPSSQSSQSHDALKRQSTSSARNGEFWQKLRFGASIALSNRYISSPHQATNTPPYSSCNPTYIPSRRTFLLRKTAIIVCSYIITDLIGHANTAHPSSNAILYSDHNIPLFPLRNLSIETLALRIGTSIGYWIGGYFAIQTYFSIWQFLAVATGFSAPSLERPIFGGLGAAYTIRGFWGTFWHQMMRCRLSATADWVMYAVLGLPKSNGREVRGGRDGSEGVGLGRLVARYTHILCCFLVSGLLHHALDVAQGMKWWESGAVQCFVFMGVGITVEDAVQWVWFDVFGGGRVGGGRATGGRKAKGSQEENERRRGTWYRLPLGCDVVELRDSVLCLPELEQHAGRK